MKNPTQIEEIILTASEQSEERHQELENIWECYLNYGGYVKFVYVATDIKAPKLCHIELRLYANLTAELLVDVEKIQLLDRGLFSLFALTVISPSKGIMNKLPMKVSKNELSIKLSKEKSEQLVDYLLNTEGSNLEVWLEQIISPVYKKYVTLKLDALPKSFVLHACIPVEDTDQNRRQYFKAIQKTCVLSEVWQTDESDQSFNASNPFKGLEIQLFENEVLVLGESEERVLALFHYLKHSPFRLVDVALIGKQLCLQDENACKLMSDFLLVLKYNQLIGIGVVEND